MGVTARSRVAVIGARGIGRHHAKWWDLEGAEVCGVAGTSEASVAEAVEGLKALFPFTGRGYVGAAAMIEAEQPDIVDVCSPASCHFDHVRTALERGCHVLCEKPFVFDEGLSRQALMRQAQELTALAAARQRRLSVCTQYSVGAEILLRHWLHCRSHERIREYCGRLEAPAKGRAADPKRVWVDLSPHPIAVALRLIPEGEADWASLKASFAGYSAQAEFDLRRPDGSCVRCVLATRNAVEPPLNVRRFAINAYPFVVEGHADADGVFCARIETPDGTWVEPDMMRALIREFLAGRTPVSAAECLKNLDIMLRVLETVSRPCVGIP